MLPTGDPGDWVVSESVEEEVIQDEVMSQ
jgi:hypothetical protein